MENEQWKDIKDYDYYQVSSDGRVRSLDHETQKRIGNILVKAFHKSKILPQTVNENGNLIVALEKDGNKNILEVYLIVGDVFISNQNNLPKLIHKDGNKTNNKAENLQWSAESPKAEWRDVVGFPHYQVSNEGCVRSIDRYTEHIRSGRTVRAFHKGRLLKPSRGDSNFLVVNLSENGKRKTMAIHRLVAETYLQNPDHLPDVRHKDGNTANNNVKNLEWCGK